MQRATLNQKWRFPFARREQATCNNYDFYDYHLLSPTPRFYGTALASAVVPLDMALLSLAHSVWAPTVCTVVRHPSRTPSIMSVVHFGTASFLASRQSLHWGLCCLCSYMPALPHSTQLLLRCASQQSGHWCLCRLCSHMLSPPHDRHDGHDRYGER